jgi:hypothetical protein
MASGKDIAGIAALAGLGYMLANRKKKEETDSSSKADVAKMKQEASSAGDDTAEDTQKLPIRPGQERSGMMMPTRPGQQRSGAVPAPIPSGGPGRRPSGPGPGAGRGGQGGPNVPTTAAMPPVGGGRGGQGGPQAGDAGAYRQQQYEAAKAAAATPEAQAERKKQAESEAIENVYPEQMIGMPGIKAVAGAAKALANRGTGQGLRTISQEALPYSGTKQIANNPTRQITGPSKADLLARDRAARAAAREEGMAAENAQRYGLDPKAPGYEAAAGAVRKNLGEDNFSLGMKRGGKVKAFASGGSVSSASSRGDGIASRGKTRGKIC